MKGRTNLLFYHEKKLTVALQICPWFEEPPLAKMPGPHKCHETKVIYSRVMLHRVHRALQPEKIRAQKVLEL